jgi:hypothetical protein
MHRKRAATINKHVQLQANAVTRTLEMMSSWSATWDLQVLQL